jgi:hypothetical protein
LENANDVGQTGDAILKRYEIEGQNVILYFDEVNIIQAIDSKKDLLVGIQSTSSFIMIFLDRNNELLTGYSSKYTG